MGHPSDYVSDSGWVSVWNNLYCIMPSWDVGYGEPKAHQQRFMSTFFGGGGGEHSRSHGMPIVVIFISLPS